MIIDWKHATQKHVINQFYDHFERETNKVMRKNKMEENITANLKGISILVYVSDFFLYKNLMDFWLLYEFPKKRLFLAKS